MGRGRSGIAGWAWIVAAALWMAPWAVVPAAGSVPRAGDERTGAGASGDTARGVKAAPAPDTVEAHRSDVRTLPSHEGVRSVVFRRELASRRSTGSPGVASARPRGTFPKEASEEGEPRHPLLLAAGGVLGGAAGLLAGGLVGGDLSCAGAEPQDDVCFLPGTFFGGTLGMSLGVPAGVHVANGTRGDWFLETGASLSIWGVGLLFLSATSFEGPGAVVAFAAMPLGQLVASTAIERSSTSSEEIP